MGVDITYQDIAVAHRLGTFDATGKTPRGIICKFSRRTDKFEIMKVRYTTLEHCQCKSSYGSRCRLSPLAQSEEY